MKRLTQIIGCLAVACLLLSGCTASTGPDKVLRHVVMFGFNEELTDQQVKEIEDAFCALPSQIEEIKGFEWGTDCSPEGLQKGLTHCFFLTFHSDKDRDTYLVHPAHKAFGQLINGKVAAVTVLDYWTK
ncbi:MAG: Dabb family protein [Parabacteroides sp.]